MIPFQCWQVHVFHMCNTACSCAFHMCIHTEHRTHTKHTGRWECIMRTDSIKGGQLQLSPGPTAWAQWLLPTNYCNLYCSLPWQPSPLELTLWREMPVKESPLTLEGVSVIGEEWRRPTSNTSPVPMWRTPSLTSTLVSHQLRCVSHVPWRGTSSQHQQQWEKGVLPARKQGLHHSLETFRNQLSCHWSCHWVELCEHMDIMCMDWFATWFINEQTLAVEYTLSLILPCVCSRSDWARYAAMDLYDIMHTSPWVGNHNYYTKWKWGVGIGLVLVWCCKEDWR